MKQKNLCEVHCIGEVLGQRVHHFFISLNSINFSRTESTSKESLLYLHRKFGLNFATCRVTLYLCLDFHIQLTKN